MHMHTLHIYTFLCFSYLVKLGKNKNSGRSDNRDENLIRECSGDDPLLDEQSSHRNPKDVED